MMICCLGFPDLLGMLIVSIIISYAQAKDQAYHALKFRILEQV
ncbi:MAG: hypothetical protein ACTJHT_13790 [Sphingobacterium sp.]